MPNLSAGHGCFLKDSVHESLWTSGNILPQQMVDILDAYKEDEECSNALRYGFGLPKTFIPISNPMQTLYIRNSYTIKTQGKRALSRRYYSPQTWDARLTSGPPATRCDLLACCKRPVSNLVRCASLCVLERLCSVY